MPFFNLPPELHIAIAESLPISDQLQLRLTCAYLYDLLPRPTHPQLLLAESSDWALHHHVLACRYCLRLRPEAQFADRMLRRRRSRGGIDSDKRFCIDCGLMPREGDRTARYGPGAQITIQNRFFVFCIACHRFLPGARDSYGRNTLECIPCWKQHGTTRAQAGLAITKPNSGSGAPIQ